jgi:hypothetical protein
VRTVRADLGDRVQGDAPDVRADVREDQGEACGAALAGMPPVSEAAEAQEKLRLILETEDG